MRWLKSPGLPLAAGLVLSGALVVASAGPAAAGNDVNGWSDHSLDVVSGIRDH
jgi:hypothetical protein